MVLTSWGSKGTGSGQFELLDNLTYDWNDGYQAFLWATDASTNLIQAFGPNGDYEGVLGSGSSGVFSAPGGVCLSTVDSSGNPSANENIYVADSGNNRVEVLNLTSFINPGNILSWGFPVSATGTWGTSGTGSGGFFGEASITADNRGYFYVADWGNSLIQVFNYAQVFQAQWAGSGANALNQPTDLAYDANVNNIVVADTGNNRIEVFTGAGVFVRKWGKNGGDGTAGTGDGEFNKPSGLDVDTSGNVFVADTNNNRIQEFDRMGNFIAKFGTVGTGTGNLKLPLDVAVDNVGDVFVADKGNFRIVKLKIN